ncbi:MAG: hypothetical protein QOG62_1913 [Thermoleophilaceae bacterium]|nr:hypothetical protein [Thermoleophilaceae bacterium]
MARRTRKLPAVERLPWSRRLLGAFWMFAGSMHFIAPSFYEAIMPSYLPAHRELVQLSGVAEWIGGAMALSPGLKRPARWWILGVLLAVFPANIYVCTNPQDIKGLDLDKIPMWALWSRLPFQGVFALWAWKATE